MNGDHLAYLVTNLDGICQALILLGAAMVMLPAAVVEGWRLRRPAERQALRSRVAIGPRDPWADPWEGLITNLAVTALALVVVLCST